MYGKSIHYLMFETQNREKADVYPLLEVDDMLAMKDKPDWKSVFTYVQEMHRSLRNHR